VVGEHRAGGGTTDRDAAAADQVRAVAVAVAVADADADRDGQLTDLPGRVRVRGHRDQRPVGAGQLPDPAGDQLQHRVGVGPGQQLGGDLGGGPQPPLAAGCLVVQAGIVDRDRGRAGR